MNRSSACAVCCRERAAVVSLVNGYVCLCVLCICCRHGAAVPAVCGRRNPVAQPRSASGTRRSLRYLDFAAFSVRCLLCFLLLTHGFTVFADLIVGEHGPQHPHRALPAGVLHLPLRRRKAASVRLEVRLSVVRRYSSNSCVCVCVVCVCNVCS